MSEIQTPPVRRLYTPAEVAERFRIDVKTVARWVQAGRIPESAVVWTLGGHRRIDAEFIDAALRGEL